MILFFPRKPPVISFCQVAINNCFSQFIVLCKLWPSVSTCVNILNNPVIIYIFYGDFSVNFVRVLPPCQVHPYASDWSSSFSCCGSVPASPRSLAVLDCLVLWSDQSKLYCPLKWCPTCACAVCGFEGKLGGSDFHPREISELKESAIVETVAVFTIRSW